MTKAKTLTKENSYFLFVIFKREGKNGISRTRIDLVPTSWVLIDKRKQNKYQDTIYANT